jgi:hypothetical protein
MIFRRPPALANWLLDRLGRNAALAGDLLEEFRGGRSAAWYWRQTFVVVAHSIASGGELRPYLLALSAAYAAQFALTLTLWATNFPPALHISAWMKFGVWLLFQTVYTGYSVLTNRLVLGTSRPDLKRMYYSVEPPAPRSTVMALAACQSFSLGLANYSLCALIFPRFSLPGLVGIELTWFVLWIFGPALIPPSAPPSPAETVEDEQPWLAIPQSEPVLSVTLPSGRTIVLERPGLAQSVFAAADQDLIRVVFGQRRSLELLRRAIWLGGYRSDSHILGRAESFTLGELAALIDETARTKSVIEAGYQTNRRESFRLRVKLWFCGDSA